MEEVFCLNFPIFGIYIEDINNRDEFIMIINLRIDGCMNYNDEEK